MKAPVCLCFRLPGLCCDVQRHVFSGHAFVSYIRLQSEATRQMGLVFFDKSDAQSLAESVRWGIHQQASSNHLHIWCLDLLIIPECSLADEALWLQGGQESPGHSHQPQQRVQYGCGPGRGSWPARVSLRAAARASGSRAEAVPACRGERGRVHGRAPVPGGGPDRHLRGEAQDPAVFQVGCGCWGGAECERASVVCVQLGEVASLVKLIAMPPFLAASGIWTRHLAARLPISRLKCRSERASSPTKPRRLWSAAELM